MSANEQYYLDAQSRIASVGNQKSLAAVTNEALFFVPGINLFMSVALASAGGERVGSGVAQAWDGDYAGAAGNLGMGALQVVGGRYGLSLGGEAAGELGNGAVNTGRQITNLERISTFEANRPFISEKGAAQGWLPPYPEVGSVRRFTTADNLPFMRLHYAVDHPQGGFLVREGEIAHLGDDAEAIRLYLGLKDKPNFISNATVPNGTQMQMGRIGPQPNFGLNNNSGIQYQLLEEIPKSSFYNTRPLK